MAKRTVVCVGPYRIYKARGYWVVMSATTNIEISRHSARDLALAAAQRYDDGNKRRAALRAEINAAIRRQLEIMG